MYTQEPSESWGGKIALFLKTQKVQTVVENIDTFTKCL